MTLCHAGSSDWYMQLKYELNEYVLSWHQWIIKDSSNSPRFKFVSFWIPGPLRNPILSQTWSVTCQKNLAAYSTRAIPGEFKPVSSSSAFPRSGLDCRTVRIVCRTASDLADNDGVLSWVNLARGNEKSDWRGPQIRQVIGGGFSAVQCWSQGTSDSLTSLRQKLLTFWSQTDSDFNMRDVPKNWFGLDGWPKLIDLRKILDCLHCLLIFRPLTLSFNKKAFGVVDYNEGLTALHCSKS